MKKFVKSLVPPIIFNIMNSLRGGYKKADKANNIRPTFEYVPQGWSYISEHPEIKGWNVKDILNVHIQNWDVFKHKIQQSGPLGFSPESDVKDTKNIVHHNIMMSFGYAFGLACHAQNQISFLDWGGAIGHYYLIARSLYPFMQIQYACKDVEVFSAYGKKLFPDSRFFSDDSFLSYKFDFVLASGSLQCVENWSVELQKLTSVSNGYLFLNRLPVVENAASFVFLQRAYSYGYNTEYLAWAINKDELLEKAALMGMELVREFITGDQHSIENAPEQCQYVGLLFKKAE